MSINPSQFLVQQKRDKMSSSFELLRMLGRLELLYRPRSLNLPVGVQQLKKEVDSGYSSETEVEGNASGKKFEREYAAKWLVAFLRLSLGSGWAEECMENDSISDDEAQSRSEVVEQASSLIAYLSETSVSGAIHRSIRLASCDNDPHPISITLLDALPSAEDPTSVGLQSWGASIILSRRLAICPSMLRTGSPSKRAIRILELGSGTGLLAIAACKILDSDDYSHRIYATDFHDAVLANLRLNILSNDCQSSLPSISSSNPTATTVDVLPLDWSAIHDLPHDAVMQFPFDKRFDCILGGDIVYRTSHSLWIHSCISRFLSFPSLSSTAPVFILIAPLRPTHVEAIASITTVFPHIDDLPRRTTVPEDGGAAWRLAIMSIESMDREWGVGRADEAGYRLYSIGWV